MNHIRLLSRFLYLVFFLTAIPLLPAWGQELADPISSASPFLDVGSDVWGMTTHEILWERTKDPKYQEIPVNQETLRVRLEWTLVEEENILSFFVFRADSPDGKNRRNLNPNRALTAAHQEKAPPQRYVFYDLDVEEGKTYYYRVLGMSMGFQKGWVIGEEKAISVQPKKIKPQEIEEIRTQGYMYRMELQNN